MLALPFCPFHMTPLSSRLEAWQCWEWWLTIVGRKCFSASAVANYISHGCCPSSLTPLAKACWKSLRWPCLLPLKSDPKGFLCTQAPSALHSRSCHVTIIPNHVSFGQSACTWLGEIAPVRVRSVCSCGRDALGPKWQAQSCYVEISQERHHDSSGLSSQIQPSHLLVVRVWTVYLNSLRLSFLTCKLSMIITYLTDF